MNLDTINKELRNKTPQQIVEWALEFSQEAILTTNFRPLGQSIIHAVTSIKPAIPVIWVDSGYNTSYTYRHALNTIERFNLNMDIFTPLQTVAYRDVVMGIPEPDSLAHDEFTRQVKLEPFARAMEKYQPKVWFTNLRKGQTEFRDSLDIVNLTKDGVLKICPFYYWSDSEMENYMECHQLDSEKRYYDPTKVLANRECGLHML